VKQDARRCPSAEKASNRELTNPGKQLPTGRHPALAEDPDLPDDKRLWAALQAASVGTWKGCVYDAARIIRTLEAGMRALGENGG